MNKVVKILMQRDGISQKEAEETLQEARQAMRDCDYDPVECEDIFYDVLGLELDYLFDVL